MRTTPPIGRLIGQVGIAEVVAEVALQEARDRGGGVNEVLVAHASLPT